jgi:hypothetical protein
LKGGARRIPSSTLNAGRAPALREGANVNLHLTIGPLIALIAGILILIVPRLLNYIVAIYLILVGLLGLFGTRLLA